MDSSKDQEQLTAEGDEKEAVIPLQIDDESTIDMRDPFDFDESVNSDSISLIHRQRLNVKEQENMSKSSVLGVHNQSFDDPDKDPHLGKLNYIF